MYWVANALGFVLGSKLVVVGKAGQGYLFGSEKCGTVERLCEMDN